MVHQSLGFDDFPQVGATSRRVKRGLGGSLRV
jgi:hypothetical protein